MTQKTPKESAPSLPPVSDRLLKTPLHKLIAKPVDDMTKEELEEYVKHLRTIRSTPLQMTRQIESDEDLGEEARKSPKAKGKSNNDKVNDLLAEYGV